VAGLTPGSAGVLKVQITSIARQMVGRWGMSEAIGLDQLDGLADALLMHDALDAVDAYPAAGAPTRLIEAVQS